MGVRVASMQEFRRSVSSLNPVPESSMQGPRPRGGDQAFDLHANTSTRRTAFTPGNRPMGSDNPLLKMMQQRMAAAANKGQAVAPAPSAPSTAMPGLSNENKAALQASISKWSGMGHPAAGLGSGSAQNQLKTNQVPIKPVVKQQQSFESLQTSSVQGSPSGRVPLSPPQIELLNQLTESQGNQQASQQELLQRLFLRQQANGVGQNPMSSLQRASGVGQTAMPGLQQAYIPVTNTGAAPRPSLTRCSFSLAEVDRLRRENQAIQLRQQLAMQEQRAIQDIMINEQQAYLHRRNIAVNALVSMQGNDTRGQPHQQASGAAPLSQEGLNQVQVNALAKLKELSPSELNSFSQGSMMKPSKSGLGSMRKRRSLRPEDDDESYASRGSLSGGDTHSITSSAASSYKVHRSLSHCSARSALPGSMENLRIQSKHNMLNNGSLRNLSFSSGLMNGHQNQSFSSGLSQSHMNTKNQSFSSGSKSTLSTSEQLRRGASSSHQAAAMRRSPSGNSWIRSLLSEQSTAGKAAATFEIAVKYSSNSLVSLSHSQPSQPSSSLLKEAQEGIVPHAPIQVQAEQYVPPPIARPPGQYVPPAIARPRSTSTSSDMVIISAVPDRIKYQNAKAGTKPFDIVKEALSSRGAKCDTKPSMNMEEDFFVKVTEMYDNEIVNAIRNNDVESLKRLSADGTNLQCGNRFGETLIHLACRRSHKDLVAFLVNDAGLSLRVRDDMGRTPMHDACWRAEPDLELLDMLLDRAPELLMLSDKRGHTPLDYSRREHWPVLVPFLLERTAKFRSV